MMVFNIQDCKLPPVNSMGGPRARSSQRTDAKLDVTAGCYVDRTRTLFRYTVHQWQGLNDDDGDDDDISLTGDCGYEFFHHLSVQLLWRNQPRNAGKEACLLHEQNLMEAHDNKASLSQGVLQEQLMTPTL
ncbi:hypothetical protein OS493_033976 [Desmophyllum pertusum]|uniref:Uncharacterized protein n=1 Tax=Desmophyllum pertusum TaxID=174260 RepID=A0A9X0D1U7_9CNID|nr:hypothetical protein OS493_033976 [Desmophyllum pertusum]